MDKAEFVAILEPLVLSMRADFDQPTWTAYYQALRGVHPMVLQQAVQALMSEPLEFFPKAGVIGGVAELQRRALLAHHPWDGCCECEDQRGFRTVLTGSGQKLVEPCPCKGRYLQKLDVLGIREPVTALPAEAAGTSEQVFPTLDQLPVEMRRRLAGVVEQKRLR
jgi:hypothetical protein